jgi:hypothetical protein
MGAEADIIAYLTSRYFGLRAFGEINGYAFATTRMITRALPFAVASCVSAFLAGHRTAPRKRQKIPLRASAAVFNTEA